MPLRALAALWQEGLRAEVAHYFLLLSLRQKACEIMDYSTAGQDLIGILPACLPHCLPPQRHTRDDLEALCGQGSALSVRPEFADGPDNPLSECLLVPAMAT